METKKEDLTVTVSEETKVFNEKLESQVNLKKTGVYEAFVSSDELRKYWGLTRNTGDNKVKMMQKVYLPVYGGEILTISLERHRAIRTLLDAAGVSSFEELEALEGKNE
jgi:hypothetical protein